MKEGDFNEFSSLLAATMNMVGCEKRATNDHIGLTYDILENELTLNEVRYALNAIIKDYGRDYWIVGPADILRKIEGEPMKAETIIGLAHAANTPFGVLALMSLGGDLKSNSNFGFVRSKAEEFRARWEGGIKQRAREGKYTDNEIAAMTKRKVDPCSHISPTMPPPVNNLDLLRARSRKIRIAMSESNKETSGEPMLPFRPMTEKGKTANRKHQNTPTHYDAATLLDSLPVSPERKAALLNSMKNNKSPLADKLNKIKQNIDKKKSPLFGKNISSAR